MRIPHLDQIAQKLFAKQLILFVGSGMSAGCYPTWGGLLKELIDDILRGDAQAEALQMLKDGQFLNAAWVIQNVIGKDQLQTQLSDKFEPRPCLDVEARYRRLNGLPFLAIFTTNYDHFLNSVEGFTHINQQDDLGAVLNKPRVLKLHGDQSKPKTMVLTSQDFTATKFDEPLKLLMEAAATRHSFLFTGYSMEDEDVLLWLERACYLGGRIPQPRHFALVDGAKWKEQKRKLYASRYSIEIVDAPMAGGYPDIANFLESLRGAWRGLCTAPVKQQFQRKPFDWPERDLYIDPEVHYKKVSSAWMRISTSGSKTTAANSL